MNTKAKIVSTLLSVFIWMLPGTLWCSEKNPPTKRSSLSSANVKSRNNSFYFSPPTDGHGLQPLQKPIEPSGEVSTDSPSKLVYTVLPYCNNHNALIVQDIPSGQLAGSTKTNSLFFSGNIVWTNRCRIGGKPDLREAGNDHALQPRLSPDGKYILIGVGVPDEAWAFKLHVLDIEKRKLTCIYQESLANQDYSWSPDGKYVLFIEGGNKEGFPWLPGDNGYIGPMSLIVLDWRTGKKWVIAKSDSFGTQTVVSWGDKSLWFSVLDPSGVMNPVDAKLQKELSKQYRKSKVKRPNIYKYNFKTKQTTLIAKDGFRPVLSPNGKWVLFYGSEKPDNPVPLDRFWLVGSADASLCIMKTDGSERRVLETEELFYASIAWLQEGNQFITVKVVAPSPAFTLDVKKWDYDRLSSEYVGKFVATDHKKIDYSMDYSRWRLLGIDAPGKHVFVLMGRTQANNPKCELLMGDYSIQSMDLESGKVQILGACDLSTAMDWRILPNN